MKQNSLSHSDHPFHTNNQKSRSAAGRSLPAWARAWIWTCSLTSGIFALLWLILRSGTKPSRFAYPCQQAAFSAAWLAFGVPLVSTLVTARRKLAAGLLTPGGALAAFAGLIITMGIWGYVATADDYRGPVLDPPRDYRAQLYHVTDCPQDPVGDRFPGLDTLVQLMGEQGLKFYQSPTSSQVSGPDGIIASDDVVMLKINYQWGERGGSNTDVLKGMIRWIVDHPDTFTGEIVVVENAQWGSVYGFDRTENNAQDHHQSPHDVVVYYQNLGYTISHFDWTAIRNNGVDEYATGDMTDGYFIYPYNAQLQGCVSYPKFQTDYSTYISVKHGIWNPGSSSYDREHLKFINLPVLKSHHATYGATACVKHYMGVVTNQLGANSHEAMRYGILGAQIGEIQLADLNILDCIWINANPNTGPGTSYAGATRKDQLVASLDPVAEDIWAVKNILIPAFIENGHNPPWPEPSADPDDPTSDFREYLDNSMNYILNAGYDVTNDPAQIDVFVRSCEGNMPRIVAGPGPAEANPPLVRVFPAAQDPMHEYEFSAYGVPRFGVNVSAANVDGGDSQEILTGAGPGAVFGPHVRGFQVTGTPLPGLSFIAYGTRKWGVNVTAGDIDGDGFDEIITGAGPGAVFGPHVRGFNYDGTGSVTPVPGVSYIAYGTRKWGVNVTAGDIDGDGYDEIITGAGPGGVFGPHVRGWNVDDGPVSAISAVSFMAYGTRKWGVNVTAGDIDGDDFGEMVTAPGPSYFFAAHVRGWNYDGISVDSLSDCNFFAWHPTQARYGAQVFAGTDLDGDGHDEIVAGAGPDPGVASLVRVFQYGAAGTTPWFSLTAFPSGWMYGAKVTALTY